MELLVQPEFWARWLGIVIIDLSLAGDNALVIAMAVLTLPPRQRLFGMIGGTLGAVVLRIALIAVITQILLIPFLQAVGGLVLMWIAYKLVRQDASEGTEQKVREVGTLWEAMGIIIVADLIMSLDNVLAVVGGGVLGWVAGELVISDTLVRGSIGSWDALLHWTLPSLLAFTMAASGWAMAYRASRLIGNTRRTREIGEGTDETLRKNT